jgi:hypothetical protein
MDCQGPGSPGITRSKPGGPERGKRIMGDPLLAVLLSPGPSGLPLALPGLGSGPHKALQLSRCGLQGLTRPLRAS